MKSLMKFESPKIRRLPDRAHQIGNVPRNNAWIASNPGI